MSKESGGKGSQPRKVDPKQFGENWDRIFKKHDKCGTPDCCNKCETAVKNSA
ncbi:MAG: hypothetical protein VW270_04990 [Candidatus Poseidoniales archaeon]